MKILVESNAFYPSVGGVQILTRDLCETWTRDGQEVVVVTDEPLNGHEEVEAFPVVRKPSLFQRWKWIRWSDAYLQTAVSVKGGILSILAFSKPVFVHHGHLRQDGAVRRAIQHFLLQVGQNIAVSEAMTNHLPVEATVIPNPVTQDFEAVRIENTTDWPKKREGFLFVGRLVREKGCDLAIRAVASLQNYRTSLTVCGDGPERDALEKLAENLGVSEQVNFQGWVSREDIAANMRQAEALIVPSRWEEPFGLVVLESLACRTPVVATRKGGLPEAVGPCGVLVEPDDVDALLHGIQRVVDPKVKNEIISRIPSHLDYHSIERVSSDYIKFCHSKMTCSSTV